MNGKLLQLLRKASGHNTDHVMMFDAEVLSVDTNKRTALVRMINGNSSNDITVRLMAAVDDGALYIPSVGSTVLVMASDYVQPVIAMYSGIDSIIWLGGDYDGVPIVTHPTNANKGLLKKINNLEDIVKDLITKYNAHTHVTTCAAGPGTANATTTQETGTITNTTQSDIEHPYIKH